MNTYSISAQEGSFVKTVTTIVSMYRCQIPKRLLLFLIHVFLFFGIYPVMVIYETLRRPILENPGETMKK